MEPQPHNDKEARTKDGDGCTAADGPPDPPPNANSTVVNIGCALIIQKRASFLTRGQGQTEGRGKATLYL